MKTPKKITKQQIFDLQKKMTPEELHVYYTQTKTSAHVFKSKKSYSRSKKKKEKESYINGI